MYLRDRERNNTLNVFAICIEIKLKPEISDEIDIRDAIYTNDMYYDITTPEKQIKAKNDYQEYSCEVLKAALCIYNKLSQMIPFVHYNFFQGL